MRPGPSNMITEIPITTETLCVLDALCFRQDQSFRDQLACRLFSTADTSKSVDEEGRADCI
jgi:hypothetical protein